MKKFLIFITVLLLGFGLFGCDKKEEEPSVSGSSPTEILPTPTPSETAKPPTVTPSPTPSPTPEPSPTPTEELKTYFILDEYGNYGGTTNRSRYGMGAPLNGANNHPDTQYYMINDYYNMLSTKNRTINTNFQPYQQTMANSDGIASALMILNHFGEDVYNEYTEVNLVDEYERLNNQTIFGNGTTASGLGNLFNVLGYETQVNQFHELGSTTNAKIENISAWIKDHLDRGRLVMVRHQTGFSYNWNVVIGIETMGTSYVRDDVLILADPYDNLDHFQDGYHTIPIGRFYRWWQNMQESGDFTDQFDSVVVYPKTPRRFERFEDSTEIIQEIPEIQLLLNPDGTYGGTRDADLWGSVNGGNGTLDHHHSIYYKFNDYFNMNSTDTLALLTGYRAFQQTMASSCGICSTLSVLNYYGIDVEEYDEVYLVEKYEQITGSIIRNKGVGANGLRSLVATFGFVGEASSYSKANYVDNSSMTFPTYDSFLNWALGYLRDGVPIPVSWRPHGGHWEVIIGIDTMGTDDPYDDVIILADSSDNWDHYQDGYNTLPATTFYRQWYNGSFTYNQQYMVFRNESIYN